VLGAPGGSERTRFEPFDEDIDRLCEPEVKVADARDPRRDHKQVPAIDRRARLEERQEEAAKEAVVVGRVF
jgi:hypothetical protein